MWTLVHKLFKEKLEYVLGSETRLYSSSDLSSCKRVPRQQNRKLGETFGFHQRRNAAQQSPRWIPARVSASHRRELENITKQSAYSQTATLSTAAITGAHVLLVPYVHFKLIWLSSTSVRNQHLPLPAPPFCSSRTWVYCSGPRFNTWLQHFCESREIIFVDAFNPLRVKLCRRAWSKEARLPNVGRYSICCPVLQTIELN